MFLFVLVGAGLGAWVGGIAGLLLGAATGWATGWVVGHLPRSQVEPDLQSRFIDVTFAVMGALCKADGRVSPAEIAVAEAYFDKLALAPGQRQAARDSFVRGKCLGFDLYGEVSSLRRQLRRHPAFLQLFLQIQLSAVAADGRVHEAEHRMMLRVARALGLGEPDLARIEAMLRQAAAGSGSRPAPAATDAYAVLGVAPSASDADIKRAYRRLMSRYHPDKFAARGLCETMRETAEARVREVRRAYDTIRRQRAA